MSFFRELESMMTGGQANSYGMGAPQGGPAPQMPDHPCARCQVPMNYGGPRSLRTGGMNRGWGVAADMFLGAGDETAINQMMEQNVLVHVFVCPQCGAIEFVNDPRRGF